MSTGSPFFTEDFIRRYKKVYPLTDNRTRMTMHEILESTEPMNYRKLTWLIKYTFPSDPSVYAISVTRVHKALKAGSTELDELRTEVKARMKKIKWYECAEALAREISRMVNDPRIID